MMTWARLASEQRLLGQLRLRRRAHHELSGR
jgi:hypothetical protein